MGNMADQNRFWSAKCRNWSENGQWPTVISSTDTGFASLNCTDEFKTMDISINKPVKDIMKNEFHQWYSDEILA